METKIDTSGVTLQKPFAGHVLVLIHDKDGLPKEVNGKEVQARVPSILKKECRVPGTTVIVSLVIHNPPTILNKSKAEEELERLELEKGALDEMLKLITTDERNEDYDQRLEDLQGNPFYEEALRKHPEYPSVLGDPMSETDRKKVRFFIDFLARETKSREVDKARQELKKQEENEESHTKKQSLAAQRRALKVFDKNKPMKGYNIPVNKLVLPKLTPSQRKELEELVTSNARRNALRWTAVFEQLEAARRECQKTIDALRVFGNRTDMSEPEIKADISSVLTEDDVSELEILPTISTRISVEPLPDRKNPHSSVCVLQCTLLEGDPFSINAKFRLDRQVPRCKSCRQVRALPPPTFDDQIAGVKRSIEEDREKHNDKLKKEENLVQRAEATKNEKRKKELLSKASLYRKEADELFQQIEERERSLDLLEHVGGGKEQRGQVFCKYHSMTHPPGFIPVRKIEVADIRDEDGNQHESTKTIDSLKFTIKVASPLSVNLFKNGPQIFVSQ